VQPKEPAQVEAVIADDNVLTKARRLSRAITDIYDSELRPFGISAIQFALLELIGRTEPTTRAAIARSQQLDKSTLSRNLKAIFSEGWVEEVQEQADGRSRPIALTSAGKQLLLDAASAWRAAQSDVEILLGREGLTAVMGCVERITRLLAVPTARVAEADEHPSAADPNPDEWP
jgi:DNA-binding MarR family transcriptional regulator